jgi:hypothetical protein
VAKKSGKKTVAETLASRRQVLSAGTPFAGMQAPYLRKVVDGLKNQDGVLGKSLQH